MSPTRMIQEMISGDQIVTTKQAGDFVVCNLSSINLGRAVTAAPDLLTSDVLERLVPIQVRMLDNVIDLNQLPVPQATITNRKYRAIGLGTFGWHHLLALQQMEWNSAQAEDYADSLYERINYLTIQASMTLAKEKGRYSAFVGSEWQNGEYFRARGYDSPAWRELAAQVGVNGLRNGWLMAVAPNMSTAQIAGSTASIDPVYGAFYYEEKKDFRRPVAAPGLSLETYPYYEKGAYRVDQFASIRPLTQGALLQDTPRWPSPSNASRSSNRATPTAPPASSMAAPAASSTGTTSPTRPSTGRTRSSRPTSGFPTKWT